MLKLTLKDAAEGDNKMKNIDGDAQYGDTRYPSTKNALAELRQRYLSRHLTGRTPKSPDPQSEYLYEYVPRSSGQQNKREKPSLPYYVVPVLYVPQKVLSSEEMRSPQKKNNPDRFIDACQKKAKQKVMMNHNMDQFDEQYSENYEFDDPQIGDNEKYYNNYAVSVSTVNDESISSQLLEDITSPPQQQEKPKYDMYEERQPFDGHRLRPGVYKYPTTNYNIHTTALAPLAPKYEKYSTSSMETYPNFQYREYDHKQKPHTAPGYTTRAAYPSEDIEHIYRKTKRRHAAPSVETDSINSNQTQSELLRQRKICMECLKHKHMAKDHHPVEKHREQPIAVQPFEPLNDIKRLLTDGDDALSSNKSDPQKDELVHQHTTKDCSTGDDYQHSSCSWNASDSKSTQTVHAAKITSATQTEVQKVQRIPEPRHDEPAQVVKDHPMPPVYNSRPSKIAHAIPIKIHDDQVADAKDPAKQSKQPTKLAKQTYDNKQKKKLAA